MQQSKAVAATAHLMRAAFDAGWTSIELGSVVGMRPGSVRARIAGDRRRSHEQAQGIEVAAPPDKPLTELQQIFLTPVDEREWLTVHEAKRFAAVNEYTLRNWVHAGLLPNTRRADGRRNLYLRADLLRVMHAPKYNHGTSYRAVLEQIERDGV